MLILKRRKEWCNSTWWPYFTHLIHIIYTLSVPVGYSLLQPHTVCIYDEKYVNGIKLTFTLQANKNGIKCLSYCPTSFEKGGEYLATIVFQKKKNHSWCKTQNPQYFKIQALYLSFFTPTHTKQTKYGQKSSTSSVVPLLAHNIVETKLYASLQGLKVWPEPFS